MIDIKLPNDSLSDAQKVFIQQNEIQGGKFIEANTLSGTQQEIDLFFVNVGY